LAGQYNPNTKNGQDEFMGIIHDFSDYIFHGKKFPDDVEYWRIIACGNNSVVGDPFSEGSRRLRFFYALKGRRILRKRLIICNYSVA
jgi:hypothetical protein